MDSLHTGVNTYRISNDELFDRDRSIVRPCSWGTRGHELRCFPCDLGVPNLLGFSLHIAIPTYSLIRSMATMLCSSWTDRLTIHNRSWEKVLAKASANPAIEAVTPEANRQIMAVVPTTQAESSMNRAVIDVSLSSNSGYSSYSTATGSRSCGSQYDSRRTLRGGRLTIARLVKRRWYLSKQASS